MLLLNLFAKKDYYTRMVPCQKSRHWQNCNFSYRHTLHDTQIDFCIAQRVSLLSCDVRASKPTNQAMNGRKSRRSNLWKNHVCSHKSKHDTWHCKDVLTRRGGEGKSLSVCQRFCSTRRRLICVSFYGLYPELSHECLGSDAKMIKQDLCSWINKRYVYDQIRTKSF